MTDDVPGMSWAPVTHAPTSLSRPPWRWYCCPHFADQDVYINSKITKHISIIGSHDLTPSPMSGLWCHAASSPPGGGTQLWASSCHLPGPPRALHKVAAQQVKIKAACTLALSFRISEQREARSFFKNLRWITWHFYSQTYMQQILRICPPKNNGSIMLHSQKQEITQIPIKSKMSK